MKLLISIEYRTRWGEQLVMRIGKRRIALQYADGGVWTGAIERYTQSEDTEYRYEIERDGACIRSEWRPHTLRLPAREGVRTLRIRDRWQEMPSDTPFYSSAFTRGIFGRGKTGSPKKATGNITLRVVLPTLRPDETLAVAGSGRELGDWKRIVPMDDSRFPEWELTLHTAHRFEYKFLIADRKTLTPILWEEGANRTWGELPGAGEHALDAAASPRFPKRRWRGAGTAIPVFSLRTEEDFGVGEFYDLKRLIDWAAATGQRVIQVQPINDTTMTGTWEDSYPYNANSTFALHPQFIRLPAAGVVEDDEYRTLRSELNALPEIDYERVNGHKLRLLRRAFERHGARTAARRDYKAFIAANRHWLIPYAAFCTLRDETGTPDFTRWGGFARYDRKAVDAYCRSHSRDIAFHCYVQYHLHTQLSEVCAYARDHGIVLKGDLPIGISRTSVDAWLYPHLFHMDSQAGAPPDAFSAVGQNWGFPTYNWERMARDGYAWWRARMAKMAEYFDAFRIDHILGFFRIWEIPTHAVHGLLGYFNPALPYSADELRGMGFDTQGGRYTTPAPDEHTLGELFGDLAGEVRATCMKEGRLLPAYATQRKVAARFPGDDEHQTRLREGLMALLDDVLFIEDPRRKGYFHPRIAPHSTHAYRRLDGERRATFDRLYTDFFYHRHNRFWQESALRKLPVLLSATEMLTCGEDLGMIPDSVPETMHELQILSLEIQRMPKTPGELFADPAHYPYFSVCTTSTHDMNPLRAGRPRTHGALLPRSTRHRGRRSLFLRAVDMPAHPRHAPQFPGDAHHPAVTGLAFDRRGAALPRPGQGTHQRPVHPPLPLALPDAPPARGVAPQGDLQRIAARHDRLQRAPLTGVLRHRRSRLQKRGTPMGTPFYHAAATKAQPFPSNHFRKSSTRDRLTTISNSGRGRAVIFSRLPRYFTMLTIAGMAMMQLRDMRKNRPGSSSSERTSSD